MRYLLVSMLVLVLVACQSLPPDSPTSVQGPIVELSSKPEPVQHGVIAPRVTVSNVVPAVVKTVEPEQKKEVPKPRHAPTLLPQMWGFFGDSQTSGREPIPSSKSPVSVFQNVWQASGFPGPASVRVDGVSGRSLAGTAAALHDRSPLVRRPWLHVQESGNQKTDGQRTPEEFGATFEAFWREVHRQHPDALKTYETAHSFQRIGKPWRDWQTTANWRRWGYASETEAISFNDEMLRRITLLAQDGIVVTPVFAAEAIDALIERIPGGYASVEAAASPNHYSGVGNFMIALAMFKALGIDLDELDFSGVAVHLDPALDEAYKTLCIEIITGLNLPGAE